MLLLKTVNTPEKVTGESANVSTCMGSTSIVRKIVHEKLCNTGFATNLQNFDFVFLLRLQLNFQDLSHNFSCIISSASSTFSLITRD